MLFLNQSIGSFDDNTHEYVSVWFDEQWVKGFTFHSVMQRAGNGAYHRLHGVQVEARYVFAACKAFACCTNMMGVRPDGSTVGVCYVWLKDGTEELRLNNKYGQPIARLSKTGYIQEREVK